MNAIKFTSGTMSKMNDSYYNLELFNGGQSVYKATLSRISASAILEKHGNKVVLL